MQQTRRGLFQYNVTGILRWLMRPNWRLGGPHIDQTGRKSGLLPLQFGQRQRSCRVPTGSPRAWPPARAACASPPLPCQTPKVSTAWLLRICKRPIPSARRRTPLCSPGRHHPCTTQFAIPSQQAGKRICTSLSRSDRTAQIARTRTPKKLKITRYAAAIASVTARTGPLFQVQASLRRQTM